MPLQDKMLVGFQSMKQGRVQIVDHGDPVFQHSYHTVLKGEIVSDPRATFDELRSVAGICRKGIGKITNEKKIDG